MADWDFPKTSSTYVEVLSELQAKANDQAKLFFGTGTTGALPIDTVRWNVSKFEKKTTLGWDPLISEYEINVNKLDNKTGAKYVNTDGAQNITGAKVFKTGAFTVESSANFKNDITLGNAASNTITVNGKIGASTFSGNVTLESTASISVGNNASIDGTLTVSSASSLSSLAVSGAASLNGAVTLGDAAADIITIKGTVHGLSDLITFGDDVKLKEDLTVDKTLTVTGAATFDGAVTLGDAAADIILINGDIHGASNQVDFADAVVMASTLSVASTSDFNNSITTRNITVDDDYSIVGGTNGGNTGDFKWYSEQSGEYFLIEGGTGNVRLYGADATMTVDGAFTAAGSDEDFVVDKAGNVTINNTLGATSLADSSVALIVKGGATIAKNLYVGGTLYESSAKELKRNIKPIVGALGKVLKLEGVSYEKKDTGKQEIGLIADDVLGIIPEVVSSKDGKAEALHYTRLTAVLVEAVKELTHKVESLEEQLQRS